MRFFSVPHAPRKTHIIGEHAGAALRQHHPERRRINAAGDFSDLELGVLARHRHVAIQRNAQADAVAVAVHRGDDRLGMRRFEKRVADDAFSCGRAAEFFQFFLGP